MHGRRSLNLELIPLDPDIDRTLRRTQRATAMSEIKGEMGDQRDNIPENVEQPIFENENARSENAEHGTWTSLHHCGSCSHLLQLVLTRV